MRGSHKAKIGTGIAGRILWSESARLTYGVLSLLTFSGLAFGQQGGSTSGISSPASPGPNSAPGPATTGLGAPNPPFILAPTFGGAYATNANNTDLGVGGKGFRLVPSLDLGEVYNDNVGLAARGLERSDLITTIGPTLDMTEDARRLQGRLVYNPQALIFARGTNADTIQQRLLGAGKAQLYQDMLFLDTSASIQQGFVSSTGAIGPTTLTTNGNLQTIRTVNASPYLREHLSSYADSETRYNFSSIDTSGGQIAPQRINEGRQSFTSGDYFGRLKWTLTGDWIRIDRGAASSDLLSDTSSTDKFARADFQYPIYQALSAIGGAGYEQITDPTLVVQPKGAIWDAGFNYQPNELISASLTYGRRFDQTDIEFSAIYALRPDLRIHAIYTQTFQTSQSQFATNLGQVTLGPNGSFIDPQTGLPINPNSANAGLGFSPFGISSGSFLDKRYEADIEATRGRNGYFFSAYDEKHTGQNFALFGTASNERIIGTSLTWTRQLWPNLSSFMNGSYSHSSFLDGSGRVDNLYSASANLVYSISATASAALSITRYQRNSNFPGQSIINDVVAASVHKQF